MLVEQDFAFHYPPSMRKLRRSQYSMSGREFGSLPAFATTVLKDVVDGEDLADVVDELSLEKEKVTFAPSSKHPSLRACLVYWQFKC